MSNPENSKNSALMRNPPGLVRSLFKWRVNQIIDPKKRERRRRKAEEVRKRNNAPHVVEYFHQIDDPYSHLSAQTLHRLLDRYEIELKVHLIPATGGDAQPELDKLMTWAHRDVSMIADHYGLSFPGYAPVTPDATLQEKVTDYLSQLSSEDLIKLLPEVSSSLWRGAQDEIPTPSTSDQYRASKVLKQGADRLKSLGHYSGAMFYYAGEWYWGVDRLFYLEQRLRELGLGENSLTSYIVPRPIIDVQGIDASHLRLDFYPSINSPYTAIIYDKVIQMKNDCGIEFHHKPVLPMVMRGVPAPREKIDYIMFDTKRESEYLDVRFGPMITPLGKPTRRTYALFSWAKRQGKDTELMSALLKCAFADEIPLHTDKGMRTGVEMAGLDWSEAKPLLDREDWKPIIASHQEEMIDGLGLWGVPSMRLSGPDGEPDISVWGQDRVWLIAAEIRRRSNL